MNKLDQPRKALGKGLGALLPTRTTPVAVPVPQTALPEELSLDVPVHTIDPNPHQPRRDFETDKLEELAQSIRSNGIIQPLVVRKAGDRYQLVAGERRLRAAKLAGLEVVPIVIREIPDDRLIEVTLIENIQREDLNPVEFAHALARMMEELNLSQEQVASRTGKDRTTIINHVRLLQLPSDILTMLSQRKLTAGHARCLLTLPSADSQRDVAHRAITQGWSVRHIERVTKSLGRGTSAKKSEPAKIDPNVKAAVQEIEEKLGTKVRLAPGRGNKGRLEIDYYSAEDLERIYETIMGKT